MDQVTELDRLRRIIPRGQRWPWAVAIASSIVTATTESVAAVSIVLLMDVLTTGGTTASTVPFVGDITRLLPSSDTATNLRLLAVAIGLFFVLKAGLLTLHNYIQSRVVHQTGARLSANLFTGYLRMPYSFHLTRNSSELLRNASWSSDELVVNYLGPFSRVISESILLIFLLGVLVVTAPIATLIAVIAMAPVAAIILWFVRPRIARLGKRTERHVNESLKAIQQGLHGIRDVKLLGRESFFGEEHRNIRQRLSRSRYLEPVLSESPRILIETLLVLLILIFVGVGSGASALAGSSMSLLALFGYAGLRMMPAIGKIVSATNRLRYGSAVASTVAADLDMFDTSVLDVSESGSTDRPHGLTDRIQAEHVSFSYGGDVVLDDIDLSIHRGESIGIVGSTGAGKSTLLDIILGLLVPTSGRVLVDGVDLQEIRASWQASIGFVPQTIYIVDDSLRRNIAYGVPDDEIDEAAVDEAVARASIRTMVDALPDGLDTIVGDRGLRLSGGQRQRVAIARALYRNPSVIVLDEGTASLDNVTEAEILNALELLRGQRTLIAVAHRLTTVRKCDRIVVLEHGSVVDIGSFDELRRRSPVFRQLDTA